MLFMFEQEIANKFDVNRSLDTSYNLATDADFSIQFITGLVPFLLIVFLLSGSQAIAVESIAGEKERNTIGTLLATPTSRAHIALGKIIALSLTALVSAASSFLGVMLSLPRLAGGDGFTLSMYGFDTYALLFVIIITTVLIFVVLLSLISAYAKTIKEAASLASPVNIVVYLVGATSLIGTSQTNLWLYVIPIYNSIQSLSGIFNLTITLPQLLLTISSNLVVLAIGVYLMTLAFNSEKMMFNK
jgi:sodium transport system permease protein